MPRIHTLISPLVAALAIVALAAPPTLARPSGTAGETEPVYWSYDYEAPAPQAAQSVDADDGDPPWTASAAAAGVCLLLGAAGTMAGRIRLRDRRPRVAA